MTTSSGESASVPWPRSSGSLSVAAHVGYGASLVLHVGLGVLALLISVVTSLNETLAPNERIEANNTQLWLAVALWVVALATLGVLWGRRSRWGWMAPLIWALIGLPLAVTHAQVETMPPPAACATAGRLERGLNANGPKAPPPIAWCNEADSPIHAVAATSTLR